MVSHCGPHIMKAQGCLEVMDIEAMNKVPLIASLNYDYVEQKIYYN